MADITDELASFLLDDAGRVAARVPAPSGATSGAPGLLRRLYESFGGAPAGPGQQVDVGAAVAVLVIPDAAQSMTFTVEVGSARLRVDGRAATAAVGLLLVAGSVVTLTGRETMHAASIIGTAAGVFIDVTYWT